MTWKGIMPGDPVEVSVAITDTEDDMMEYLEEGGWIAFLEQKGLTPGEVTPEIVIEYIGGEVIDE